jgi:dTDP-glucose 4,6-dehydratase
MKVLVTGGAGFIGSEFVRLLLRGMPGFESIKKVTVLDSLTYSGNLDNLSSVSQDPRLEVITRSINDPEVVKDSMQGQNLVFNFAAESHVDRSIDSPEPFFQTNVIGTLRLLNCVKQYWLKLSEYKKSDFRFLHVSTDEVYGSLAATDAPWNEECPYEPNSPYAASKAASDHLVRSFHHTYHLPTITTNCSNNYGPYHFPEKLIPLMILNALEGKPLPIYGDGQQIRDWLYVEDHATAIWLALTKGRVGETYNVGGLNERPNLEIVNRICSILDRRSPRADGKSYAAQIIYVADRPGHDRRYAIDSTKIRRELGWCPQEDFETGIEKTVEWYLTHRRWSTDITVKKYSRERLGIQV